MASYADVIGGLRILAKKDPESLCAEHDVIYAGHDVTPAKLSAEELAEMERMGWHWDDDVEGWRHYV